MFFKWMEEAMNACKILWWANLVGRTLGRRKCPLFQGISCSRGSMGGLCGWAQRPKAPLWTPALQPRCPLRPPCTCHSKHFTNLRGLAWSFIVFFSLIATYDSISLDTWSIFLTFLLVACTGHRMANCFHPRPGVSRGKSPSRNPHPHDQPQIAQSQEI